MTSQEIRSFIDRVVKAKTTASTEEIDAAARRFENTHVSGTQNISYWDQLTDKADKILRDTLPTETIDAKIFELLCEQMVRDAIADVMYDFSKSAPELPPEKFHSRGVAELARRVTDRMVRMKDGLEWEVARVNSQTKHNQDSRGRS